MTERMIPCFSLIKKYNLKCKVVKWKEGSTHLHFNVSRNILQEVLWFPKLPNCFGTFVSSLQGKTREQSQTKESQWEPWQGGRGMSSKEAELLTSFTALAFELLSSYKCGLHLCSSVCPTFLGTLLFFLYLLTSKQKHGKNCFSSPIFFNYLKHYPFESNEVHIILPLN